MRPHNIQAIWLGQAAPPARLDEAAPLPSDLARPKLRPASQIAIWMSIDIISAAGLRLIALGEPPPVINRCELRQLPWHGKGRASLQRPRQVEPHRLKTIV